MIAPLFASRRWICALAVLAILHLGAAALAQVQLLVGPTPIPGGEARGPGDITVINEKLAFALAVDSPVPYGVPRGAIVDIAPVEQGRIGRDRVVFADFIPNNWSAWPNRNHQVEIIERGPDQVAIRVQRDWGEVSISTIYRLSSGADRIELQTTMTNLGRVGLDNLLSGFTLWPKGGALFAVPGLAGIDKGPAQAALSDRVVAYDEAGMVALHAPYFDHIGYGSKDMFQQHSLAPGESRRFSAALQVGARGDLAPVIAAEIERKHLAAGRIEGEVRQKDGKPVVQPVVVIEKDGQPYGWVLGEQGRYHLTLPTGDYRIYATAKGFSDTARRAVTIAAEASITQDFRDLAGPGRVNFSVTDGAGKPLDARLSVSEGQQPLVAYLGKATFFTALDRPGQAELTLAPGHYVFSVSAGGGFLSDVTPVAVEIVSGRRQAVPVAVPRLFQPAQSGWLSADLHHHADQAEAVTPPADLARSQLAAGLDLLFVSDHDSTVNHAALQAIAERRGVAFIPGIELSPSWGHFNAFPLHPGQAPAIDTSTASIDEVFAEARRQGAIVIEANHPYLPYGYFSSVADGVAKGGFNPAFDLVEINAAVPDDDDKVVQTLWRFWNEGHRYYLSAGTDTHDVWSDQSGRVRSYAHLDGKVTPAAFAEALKAGHSYVTYGPLIFPSVMFGDQIKLRPGEDRQWAVDLAAVNGLADVTLISGGAVLARQSFPGQPRRAHVDFTLKTDRPTWCAVIVTDRLGRKAYSNPVWLDVVASPNGPVSDK